MKVDRETEMTLRRMGPGVTTLRGFLGNDTRALDRIIEEDDIAVISLGMTHTGVANRMRYLTGKAKSGMGEPVFPDGRRQLTYLPALGRVSCPFGACGSFPKDMVRVLNKSIDRQIQFSALCVHLIEEHHFYQGRGSPFRLDPRELRSVLW